MKRCPAAYLLFILLSVHAALANPGTRRPMTFMDIVTMRSVERPVLSPDGKWMLYALATRDWNAGKTFTDIYLVSVAQGFPSTRQMTFTKNKNESSPQWSRDSKFFAFLSDRDAPEGKSIRQIYLMYPDGGEARKITDAKDGVGSFAFSKDGKFLAFTAGKEDERRLWIASVPILDKAAPRLLTKRKASVVSWQFSPDSKRIYFVSADSLDTADRDRKAKKFDVRIRNENRPLTRLFAVDIDTKQETVVVADSAYAVTDFTISKDSKWIGFHGIPNNRYLRTVTESRTRGEKHGNHNEQVC